MQRPTVVRSYELPMLPRKPPLHRVLLDVPFFKIGNFSTSFARSRKLLIIQPAGEGTACGRNATPQVPQRRPMRRAGHASARIVREPQSIGGPSEMLGNDDRLRQRSPVPSIVAFRRLRLRSSLRRRTGMSKAESQMSKQKRRPKHEQSFVDLSFFDHSAFRLLCR